jgi:FGGY-family pentulose kinase
MRQETYFVGIDMGTQGVRCGIINGRGNIITAAETNYSIYFPKPGYAVQKPEEWMISFDAVITKCLNDVDDEVRKNIKGITICATSSTVIPVDQNGTALSDAILWMDNRAKKEAEQINATGHPVLKQCGDEVSVEWLIPKALWIKQNDRQVYQKAYKIVEQLDLMNFYLTGNWSASVCQATCKGNYVSADGGWNGEYFAQIGLGDYKDKINTKVLSLGEVAGYLKKELCERYRLPENTPVFQGGIDAHIAMLGMGVCAPGDMGIIMGTSFVHLVLSKKPVYTNGIWGPYKDAVIPGLYCLEGGQVSAGSITKWFLNEFSVTGDNPYMIMADEANKTSIGSKGVMTLDFFQGNRTPYKDPHAKGVFYGLTLNHTRGDIYRSILESVAYGTRNIIESMSSDEVNIDRMMVCGGVTKNPHWLKIIADVTGKPITLTKNSFDGGILGCAIVSAVGSGLYKSFGDAVEKMVEETDVVYPDESAHAEYSKYFEKYLKLYSLLKDYSAE